MTQVVFGDPWHGRWDGVSGNLTTPGEVVMPLPGIPPHGGYSGIGHGDAFLIQIPGLPAPLNPPSEAAAGRTWVNYAMIVGADHRLYGKALGSAKWIYIANDNTPWLATIETSLPTDGGFSEIPLTLKLKRFGLISGLASEQTISLGSISGTFSTGPALNATGYMFLATEDIHINGRKVLLSLPRWYSTIFGFSERAVHGMVLLEISGTPPAANASATLIFDQVTQLVVTSTGSTTGSTGDPYIRYDGTFSRQEIFGARFNASGAVDLVVMETTGTVWRDRTLTDAGESDIPSGASGGNGRQSIKIGGTEVWGSDWTASGAWDESGPNTWSAAATLDGQTLSGSGTYDEYVSASDHGPMDLSGCGYVTKPGHGPWEVLAIRPYRYTNALYGKLSAHSPPSGLTNHIFGAVWGKAGSDGGSYETAVVDPKPVYCAEHPITGAILRGLTPRSFV